MHNKGGGRGTLQMQDWKMQHPTAMVENAGLENAGNDIVWNTVYSSFLFSRATTCTVHGSP